MLNFAAGAEIVENDRCNLGAIAGHQNFKETKSCEVFFELSDRLLKASTITRKFYIVYSANRVRSRALMRMIIAWLVCSCFKTAACNANGINIRLDNYI